LAKELDPRLRGGERGLELWTRAHIRKAGYPVARVERSEMRGKLSRDRPRISLRSHRIDGRTVADYASPVRLGLSRR
jgi:hypothetical protein